MFVGMGIKEVRPATRDVGQAKFVNWGPGLSKALQRPLRMYEAAQMAVVWEGQCEVMQLGAVLADGMELNIGCGWTLDLLGR